MGHASSIALGIALHKPDKRVWCIDGDGAAIMHMGAMATIGALKPKNFVHVLINNHAHESVGGMPTVKPDFCAVAKACGYEYAVKVDNSDELDMILREVENGERLHLIETMCAIGARKDLGRPKMFPRDEKRLFMHDI